MDAHHISFPANGGETGGYLAIPESGRGPGVIVLQEWWGLVPHIQDLCNRFSNEGFVALAPDLYHGESTTSPDDAGKLMMALRIDQAEADLRGAVEFLVGHKATQGERVGIVGFCMGGQLALYAAGKNPAIGPTVDFYGVHPNVSPDYKNIRGPVLGFFAENDTFVNAEVVCGLEEKLRAAGVEFSFQTYPGTDHAFFNDTREAVYEREAAEDSWTRMLECFRRNIG